MVGQTYGTGKDARTVTRITGFRESKSSGMDGMVYWKRPGGNERRVGKYLPHFLQWIEEQAHKVNRTPITKIDEIELYISALTPRIEGYIEQVGNDVTIKFTIK